MKLRHAVEAMEGLEWLEDVVVGKVRRRGILTDDGFVRAALRVARRLRDEVGLAAGTPEFRARLRRGLSTAWRTAPRDQRDDAVRELENLLRGLPSAFLPGAKRALGESGLALLRDSRRELSSRYRSLEVAATTVRSNERAAQALSTSSSVFFSGEYERRAARFRDRAQATISVGIERGLGSRDVAKDLEQEFGRAVANEPYWETVAANHVARARSFSSVATYAEAGVSEYEVVAILDSRTTPLCFQLAGMRFRVEAALDHYDELEGARSLDEVKGSLAPFGERRDDGRIALSSGAMLSPRATAADFQAAGLHAPPFHYRCYPGNTRVQGRVLAVLRMFYEGETLEILTKGGRRLTLTPNHPVLTPDGFIPAQKLSEGQDLLCHAVHQDRAPVWSTDDVYEEHQPTAVQEVFRSLAERGPIASIDRVAGDLHGDASAGIGQIEVVTVDRELTLELEAQSREGSRQEILVHVRSTPSTPRLLGGPCSGRDLIIPVFMNSGGFPCGTALPDHDRSEVGACSALLPLEPLRLGPASRFVSRLSDSTDDDGLRSAELARELLGRFPGQVATDDLRVIEVIPPLPHDHGDDSGQADGTNDYLVRNSAPLRQGVNRGPGSVLLDQVSQVFRRKFVGHVYDLRTVGGWAVADGVFVSNCRSTIIPVI